MYRLRVKEVLKARNITMGKLSRGADVPLNTVRRMCNDLNYNPTANTLKKVADYLGVSMDDLYYDDAPEQQK